MEQIYLKIKKIVKELSERYNIKNDKKSSQKTKINNKLIKKKKKKVKFLRDINEEEKVNYVNELKYKNDGKNQSNKSIKIQNLKMNDNKKKEFENKTDDKMGNNENKNKQEENQNINDNMTFFKDDSLKKSKIDSNHIEKNSYQKESSIIKDIKNSKHKSEDIKSTKDVENINSRHLTFKSNSKAGHEVDEYYKEREINDEIYKNEIFDYNNQKQSLIFNNNFIFSEQESNKLNDSFENGFLNDSNKSFHLNKQLFKSAILTKNGNLSYNKFNTLISTKENNFQIKSSYENINKISNNKYIKDINLQNKTRHFIEECTNDKSLRKSNFLKFPGTPKGILSFKNPFEKKNSFNNNKLGDFSDKEFNTNINSNKFKLEFMGNSTSRSFNKDKNNEISKLTRIKKVKNLSTNKLPEIKNFKRNLSSNNILESKKAKNIHIGDSNKLRKKLVKKETQKVNKKLNTIFNNIKNVSNSINNPDEFYMNFFNNIIQKETHSAYEENQEERIKKDLSNYSSIKYNQSILSANHSQK